MVWPFSRKKKKQEIHKLIFKDGASFLQYQCEFGHTDIAPNNGVVALVMDSTKEFGTGTPVSIDADGRQLAMVKVASEDGGFVVPAYTPTDKGERLKPDDIVIWVPVTYAAEAMQKIDGLDPRFGWVGFIVAKISPEIDTTDPNFRIVCVYD